MPCDHCGKTDFDTLYQNPDYISGQAFAVVRCRSCGLSRTALPNQTDLSDYYGPTYYGQTGRRFPAPMEWLVSRFRHRRVQTVRAYRAAPGRILDVGCGRGWMLAELQSLGWDVVGTELSPELAAAVSAQHRFPVHAHDTLHNLPPASFDMVTLWHVLEHLPHPSQTLGQLAQLLKPGGLLLVEVPNLASWQAMVGGGRWFHLDCPRHVHHFTPQTLQAMLSTQGFSPLTHTTRSWEYGPYGFAQSLLNRLTDGPNALYAWLKGQPPALPRDALLSVLMAPNALFFGTLAETLAIQMGGGAVLQVLARRDVGT